MIQDLHVPVQIFGQWSRWKNERVFCLVKYKKSQQKKVGGIIEKQPLSRDRIQRNRQAHINEQHCYSDVPQKVMPFKRQFLQIFRNEFLFAVARERNSDLVIQLNVIFGFQK